MNHKYMVRAYKSASTYDYRWCASPEEQELVAAEYARTGFLKRATSVRARPYLRVCLVTYVPGEDGKDVESLPNCVYKRAGRWPYEVSEPVAA